MNISGKAGGDGLVDRARAERLMRAINDIGRARKDVFGMVGSDCPIGSLSVLGVLARNADARVGQVAEILHIDISVASRHLSQLEAHGYVARSPDPADRRAQLIHVTAAGQRQLDEVWASMGDFFGAAIAGWSDTEIAYLTEQLQRLAAALDQAREAGVGFAALPRGRENAREKATDRRESGVKALS
jgi:DNA-binding MarR family transcriptional regulator